LSTILLVNNEETGPRCQERMLLIHEYSISIIVDVRVYVRGPVSSLSISFQMESIVVHNFINQ
jgi:hypothetical protein